MLLEGLHIPITTPFHPDGSVALSKLAANVARYSKTPAAGLIVLGPSGEPTLLSDDETRDVLRTAAEAAAPEKVLLASIARDSVRSVLALADFAAEQHYDAILVGVPQLPPLEYGGSILFMVDTKRREKARLHHRERLAFFQAVADRSPLPLVLFSRTGNLLPIPGSRELLAHPNIIGSVEACPSNNSSAERTHEHLEHYAIRREFTVTSTFAAVTSRMKLARESASTPALVSAASLAGSATAVAEPPPLAPTLRTRTKSVGFQILSGNSSSLLAALNAGATGIAPAFATCAPQACYEVYAAWKDGDAALAEEKQARIREAASLAESLGPGGLKYACDLNGYAAGLPRLPYLPPTGEQRAALETAMQGLRN